MRVLFLGDIVGRSGRRAVLEHLPELKRRLEPDFIVINGENAAGGFGITEKICNELFDAGADVILVGRDTASLNSTAEDIRRLGREAVPLHLEGVEGRQAPILALWGQQVRRRAD